MKALYMATAAARSVELAPQGRWETLWIPPLREREEFKSRARKCMREGKIDMEQMIIYISFVDYGVVTDKLADPSRKEGVDIDRGLVARVDELCEIACNELRIPMERAVETANLFVKLGLIQGLDRVETDL